MMNFIDEKIRDVFNDFQREAERADGLCACKGLTYEGGHAPEYENLLVQQYYMLRFFPAYLAEYRLMYEKMLQANFLHNQLKILSIGCGCGVDLWGLNFAVQGQEGDPGARISYTGVDITDWQYQNKLGIEKVRFINKDITEWDRLDEDDYNIFVFPKCVGEFSNDAFDSICSMFENTEFSEQRVCGLCSLMAKGKAADVRRFRRIAQIMQDSHGFQCLDNSDKYWTFPDGLVLWQICPSFYYPEDILDQAKELLNECPTYLRNEGSCEDDCRHLNRWPILRASYINYQLLRFERE